MVAPVMKLTHASDARSSLVQRAPAATTRLKNCTYWYGKICSKHKDFPAFGQICFHCKRLNHFESLMCFGKKNDFKPETNGTLSTILSLNE